MFRILQGRAGFCRAAILSGYLFLVFLAGCVSQKYMMAPDQALPGGGSSWDIRQSPYLADLRTAYGKGAEYERAKIRYLLGHTRLSGHQFVRNGCVYDAPTTESHLRKKYMNAVQDIHTARDFIDHIASVSSASGRAYLALPGDGQAYQTRTIMLYELERVEKFMEQEMAGK